MSGINGGNASRSNDGNRSSMASSIVIDLTGDGMKDKRSDDKQNKKAKKKPIQQFIDLTMTSDDEPPAPAKVPGPGKSPAKTSGKSPANAPSQPPAKSPKYQNGGTYNLLSESDSEDEPRMKVSGSASKEIRDNPENNTMIRQSPSNSNSNVLGMASIVPPRRGTARKTGSVSHRNSNSRSVGPVISNLAQNNSPGSATSTPGVSKSHGTLSRSGSTSNLSHIMGEQSSSKATTSLTSDHTQPHPSTAKSKIIAAIPVARSLAPKSINDAHPRKESASNIPSAHPESERVATPRLRHPSPMRIKESPVSTKNNPSICHRAHDNESGSENNNEPPAKLNSQKKNDLSQEFRMEGEAGYSKSKEEGRRAQGESQMDPIPTGKPSASDKSSEMVRQEIILDDIKKNLANVEETMREDRGLNVRLLLEKRQMRAQIAMNIDSLDDESPFAFMKAADADTEGAVKLKLPVIRKTKPQIYVVPIVIGDCGVERTPSYTHHTNIMRNHLTGDDEKLRYIPIVDDETPMDQYVKNLKAAYVERCDDPRVKEFISQIDRYLDGCLEKMGYENCDRAALVRYFLGHQSEKLSYFTREKNLVLKTLGGPLSGQLYNIMKQIAEEMNKAWTIEMEDVVLSKCRFKELVESSKAQLYEQSGNQPPPPERLETMSQFHCLICHAAACTTHGEYTLQKVIADDGSSEPASPARSSRKSDWEYVWERIIMHCPDAFRRHNARDHSKRDQYWHPEDWNTDKDTAEACGDGCYREKTEWLDYSWTQEEEEELKRMLSIIKPNRPCSIVDIIDKPCWQIYSKILDFEDKTPVTRGQRCSKQQKCEPVGWYDPKAVPRNRGLKPGWQDDTIAHMHDLRVQFFPCVHDGPCRSETNCSCVKNSLLCEQFCGCPDDCGRRFAGCSCHAEGLACISDTCICIQMNRECGDQCDTCGAIPRIRPQNRHKERLFQTGCQNIALQRGVNKKLMLGQSQLQGVGFGLFTAEPVRKGEFLSEYNGEVISVDESERRTLIHNDEDPSFLFDLNKDWVVDASRLGNKTRFINHAETEADGQNCFAKIMLVNGEHRIGFRASRDIKIGEELFFNYGKKFAEIQGLDKKIGDRKHKMPKTNKGVVTGAEALAALDGLGGERGARKRKRREMVEALEKDIAKKKKGSRRGRPRGQASKKAGSLRANADGVR
ncbi:hypothetical protein DSL72_001732 [Monilinia vaccinii-corymbosi]|uniref:SET domain-containing protein n=1 Tax=Monilinia vaccinii-corymbosi TaxID=61207 RepID=A0A8A3P838_9HELO|nr:hypothetical protein DSL72_001732 [Monilinia vaccinii-corymbosi]